MRTLGRIILFITSACMIAYGIFGIMQCVELVKTPDFWINLVKNIANLSVFIVLITSCFIIIMGISAFFAAIGGRGGFWFTIFSILSLAISICAIVLAAKAGQITGPMDILKIVATFALFIAYALGFVFLKIGYHKSK